jgi:hypothetical protein
VRYLWLHREIEKDRGDWMIACYEKD